MWPEWPAGFAARGTYAGPMRRVLSLLMCSMLLTGCTGEQNPPGVTGSTPMPGSGSPPAAEARPTTSPFSGRPGGVDTPVMVVKLDNTPWAQPHQNLVAADVVYVEPVEWGLIRLAAVFSTRMPRAVGPVRSARVSDIRLFAPYGKVAFVYSGAQQRLQPRLDDANWIVVSEDLDERGFHRDRSRPSPYDLIAEPRAILKRVGPVAKAKDMGLVFKRKPVRGGRRARVVTATWPESQVQFRWNARVGKYDVWFDGRQARDTAGPGVQRASTVIVQYVEEFDSGFGDKFGGVTPKSVTVGSGRALMLRDGRVHKITWRRRHARQPTSYRDSAGEPIVLDPGQLWIVLKNRDRKVTIG